MYHVVLSVCMYVDMCILATVYLYIYIYCWRKVNQGHTRPVIIGGAKLVMYVLVYMVAMTGVMLLYT